MIVTAIKVDEYEGYIIHGFSRAGSGRHSNNYVKIARGGVLGKFMFDGDVWDGKCLLGKGVKKRVEKYLIENKLTIQQKIKDLG